MCVCWCWERRGEERCPLELGGERQSRCAVGAASDDGPSVPTAHRDCGQGLCKTTTVGVTKKNQGKEVTEITEVE